MPTGPNYRPNIQLPNLMGHTGNPYDLNLYPQDMIFEKPAGWDDTKGVIDTSNPQVMHAGFSWPFGRNQGLESNRPSGIDTLMNYQDQIRFAPGGNYQNWQDLIVDDTRGANLIESDFDRVQNIHDQLGTYDDEGTGRREISYKDSPIPFSGFFTGDRRLHPDNPLLKLKSPITGIMGAIKDQFEYRPSTETAWDPNTGEMVTAEEQDKMNALGGYYSDAARNQRRQRARVVNMLARQAAGKSFSERNLRRLQELGYGPEEVISQVTDVVQPGRGTTYTGPETRSFDPGIAARTQHPSERAGTRGGYTDPGRGSYGPWMAEGGRAGYANGELVEDENIEGPGFDENILEIMKGQGVPFGEQVQGEQDILSMLVAKYIEAGFPPDQAQEIAMQELQQMVAQSGQGEGIASLV